MTPQGPNSRNMRLAGGRRVRVLNLLRAGLLTTGEELLFDRRRIGEIHRAIVTPKGQIRLADGQEFATPSSAAKEVAGGTAIDGWNAWTISRSGELLDTVRQRYLDEIALDTSPETSEQQDTSTTLRAHEFLKAAREAASRRDPHQITVRALIDHWGAASRSATTDSVIENDLANHGLTTVPSFRKVGIETPVFLQLLSQPGNESPAAPSISEDDTVDNGLTVGNLPSALSGVVSVSPQSTFDEAITKMLLNDYSQLAVLSGPFTLRGTVTWKSIAQARHDNPHAVLADAISPVDTVAYDTELIDVLDRIYDDDFIFVRGPDTRLAGIVTAADVVLAYRELSMPFLLVGQIDMLLRQLIAERLAFEDVVSVCDLDGIRGLTDYDDLTIGDYLQALRSPHLWNQLDWRVDRRTFTDRLDKIRQLRNDITHFNPDPLPSDATATLKHFMVFLKEHIN